MIHPSTMAGPNLFPGSFGTTNPFQQSTSPFGGQQGGFGFGINPFQSQQFGTNPMQLQHTIQEIVRQIVPTVLASSGIQPSSVFQTPFGGQQGGFGGSMPFGSPFQNPLGQNPLQGPTDPIQELIRQVTNQVIPGLSQQGLGQSQGFPGMGWQNPLQQPGFGGGMSQIGGWQQPQQQQLQQLQQLAQLASQVCQQVAATVIRSLTQPNLQQGQNIPFNLQSTPFATPNMTSQYGVTPGIPTGVGAF